MKWNNQLEKDLKLCIRSLFWLYIFLTPAAFGNLVYNYFNLIKKYNNLKIFKNKK